jgi:hypothetical protein
MKAMDLSFETTVHIQFLLVMDYLRLEQEGDKAFRSKEETAKAYRELTGTELTESPSYKFEARIRARREK